MTTMPSSKPAGPRDSSVRCQAPSSTWQHSPSQLPHLEGELPHSEGGRTPDAMSVSVMTSASSASPSRCARGKKQARL
jgi:hypothetical protein